ncbi:MAG: hypothetical protein IT324_11780 [Anaerolineae bacterium]|nr:hypothetical protein [Anaerolineae bacterium]
MMTLLDHRLTKRQLGLLFLVFGVLGMVGLLALDVVRPPQVSGIGPAQKLALLGCGGLAVLGVTLIPLGSRPVVAMWAQRAAPLPAEQGNPAAVKSPRYEVEKGFRCEAFLRWLRRILIGIALALMIGHFIVYVNYGISLAQFPFDYDQGEGFELNDTVLLSQGQSPYRDNAVYPFYASNYPPLYHVVLVPFVWAFGPQYWYGRLFGFLATVIAAAAIGYAVYRETQHRPVALLSGLAFLASNYIYHIGPLFRQHISMVMLETLTVVIIAGIDFDKAPKRWRKRLILGLLLLLAAGYTKQLAIVTAAAVFIYLFLIKPRRAILWGVIFAAVAGAIFLLLNVSTGGQWWINIITANVNQYIFNQFTGLLRQFVSLHGALLVLAIGLMLYELYVTGLSLYSIWFVAAAINGVLAGKWGAGDSYFATMIAAMCIMAGLVVGRGLPTSPHPPLPSPTGREGEPYGGLEAPPSVWGRGWGGGSYLTPIIGLVGCTLFILYGLAVIHLPLDGPIFSTVARTLNIQSNTKFANFYDSAGWVMGYATIGQIPTTDDTANGYKIVEAAESAGSTETPILSEEAAFSFHLRKPVVTNPTQLLNLYQNNHYDPAALVRMIEDQAFGAVIFRARFYPQPVLDAVDRAYKIQTTIPMNGYEYTILLPDLAWRNRQTTVQR